MAGAKEKFSPDVTLFCKGIAILMLLFCHLFMAHNVEAYPLWMSALARRMGLCVPIFLVLSGYGLYMSKRITFKDILSYRIPKLLINYWVVAAVFIVITIVFFGYSFHDAYPPGLEWRFALQMFGLNVFGGGPAAGFNPTWWFMNAIVLLYLMFPLLCLIVRRSVILALLFSITIANVPILSAEQCVVPFVVGIIAAHLNLFESILKEVGHTKVFLYASLPCMLGMLFMANHHNGGGYGAFAVLALFALHSHLPNVIKVCVEYLGKHSMNMFLCHTFFLRYFLVEHLTGKFCPFLAFALLLSASLISSIVIERLKQLLGINMVLKALKK